MVKNIKTKKSWVDSWYSLNLLNFKEEQYYCKSCSVSQNKYSHVVRLIGMLSKTQHTLVPSSWCFVDKYEDQLLNCIHLYSHKHYPWEWQNRNPDILSPHTLYWLFVSCWSRILYLSILNTLYSSFQSCCCWIEIFLCYPTSRYDKHWHM